MNLPLVSVLVTARDDAARVGATLDDVFAQDYPSAAVELIVVDDGSQDATADVLDEYRQIYPGRLRVLRQPRAGAAAALDRALREARGELLAPLAAGDRWPRTRLSAQVALLERRPEVGLVYSRLLPRGGEHGAAALGRRSWRSTRRAGAPSGGCCARRSIAPSSLLLRATLLDRITPIPGEISRAGWWLTVRAAKAGEIEWLPEAPDGIAETPHWPATASRACASSSPSSAGSCAARPPSRSSSTSWATSGAPSPAAPASCSPPPRTRSPSCSPSATPTAPTPAACWPTRARRSAAATAAPASRSPPARPRPIPSATPPARCWARRSRGGRDGRRRTRSPGAPRLRHARLRRRAAGRLLAAALLRAPLRRPRRRDARDRRERPDAGRRRAAAEQARARARPRRRRRRPPAGGARADRRGRARAAADRRRRAADGDAAAGAGGAGLLRRETAALRASRPRSAAATPPRRRASRFRVSARRDGYCWGRCCNRPRTRRPPASSWCAATSTRPLTGSASPTTCASCCSAPTARCRSHCR